MLEDIRCCRFPLADLSPDSKRIPRVSFDSQDPELPCIDLFGDSLLPSMVASTVPEQRCLNQRKADLCPRGLTDLE